MANQPEGSNAIPGDGPGEYYVNQSGIIRLAAYLLILTLVIIWQLAERWPNCDSCNARTQRSSDTPMTGGTEREAKGAADQVAIFKVTRADPSSGALAGGQVVTLSGTGFKDKVKIFFGDIESPNTQFHNSSEITTIAPPRETSGQVPIKAVNPDGAQAILPSGYTYGTPPSPSVSAAPNPTSAVKVISVAPKSGDTSGETSVQIAGEGFLVNPVVRFGDAFATDVQRKSTTLIIANTPPHSEGTVDVIVTNSDGSSGILAAGYTYDSCLAQCRSRLLILVLLAGALGGCFHALRSLWVFVGNRSFRQSWTLMYIILPVNAAVLAFIFFIIISAGNGFFSQPQGSNSCFWIIGIAALVGLFSQQAFEKLKKIADAFFTTVPPKADSLVVALSITSIAPAQGPAGTTVQITGTGFTNRSVVTFGSIAGDDLKFTSSSSISVKAPSGNSGTVEVVVNDPGTTTKAVKPGGYTYTSP